jgi:hypothetical protein
MNSLCNVSKDIGENAIKTLDREHTRVAKTIHVLFVGPVDCGSMVHDALLDRSNFRLTITTDYRELWGASTQESIQVATHRDRIRVLSSLSYMHSVWPRSW